MKIVTLIEDGLGRLHLCATCAPELVRREVSAETGTGHLVWCGLAPHDLGARQLVEEIRNRVGVDANGCLDASKDAAVKALIEATAIAPRRRERIRHLKRCWRRMRRLLAGPASHATS